MNIHFIGCLGASMSVLMDLASSRGHTVSGSDKNLHGHDPENVNNADLVVYTNAVKQGNCELMAAKRLGLPTVERARYLGDVAHSYDKCVAIAGCHGKSTTTAMTGCALSCLNPTVHVGATGASRIGDEYIFVTEACEYNRSFHFLIPSIAVVLNIAYDHPDSYKTESELIEAYLKFIRSAETALVNGDDPILSKTDCIKFGLGAGNFYRAENITNQNGVRSFDFTADGKKLKRVTLSVCGMHNVYNALASLAVSHILGVSIESAANGIKDFRGIARRNEYLGYAHGKAVYSDYAHHPDEIDCTLSALHELFDSVTVVFQPHTYSRTAALYKQEAKSLSGADTVIVAPIFAAREKYADGVSSQLIVNELNSLGKNATGASSLKEAANLCVSSPDKAVVFMGAGDITEAADFFMRND